MNIGGRWVNAAKFLTGALLIGSLAIRIIPGMQISSQLEPC
ncbi:hypothetical protein HanPSC8_Chr10g0416281 [Helianthus annuus]|nr:hypothetical protein HanPSC8_Chr10g0416281 [Helianthus annuus]